MRRTRASSSARLFVLALLSGCAASHGGPSEGDAAVPHDGAAIPDASCGPMPPSYCLSACGADSGRGPVCTGGSWTCPPGTIDASRCPPTCPGPPPGRSCRCDGTTWECATSSCGDSEPVAGDSCADEGATCGACCPTPASPPWSPYRCTGGRWERLECLDLVCPPVESCPVDLEGAIGHACSAPGASCGEVCCGSIVCRAGVWQRGPEVGCACEPESFFACGGGTCTVDRACTGYCGPDDGLEHRCDPLPPGCTSCDCVAIPPHMTCEERDGHLFFRELGFCG